MIQDNAVRVGKFQFSDSIYEARILIVDDCKITRTVLEEILRKKGFKHIFQADGGREGLQVLENINPALIILDMMMPDVDGIAFCTHVRSLSDRDDIRIIVQTGIDDWEQRTQILLAGANDLIGKPVSSEELIARTGMHLERGMLLKQLHDYQKQMTQELQLARSMQQQLIPNPLEIQQMETRYQMKISSVFEPCSAIGGDLWGIFPLDEQRFCLYAIDMSGHGVGSAINTFRMHLLLQEYLQGSPALDICMDRLNQKLYSMFRPGQFATTFIGIIDRENHQLDYVGAGFPSPFLLNDKEQITWLDTRGIPLGISLQANYNLHSVPFHAGESLVIYSDALTESRNKEGDMLSELTLADTLQKNYSAYLEAENPSQKMMTDILTAYYRYSNVTPQDDLTIVSLHRQ
jgi:sigma-B regulation protein RsbU (phosphoserine phosphatase)